VAGKLEKGLYLILYLDANRLVISEEESETGYIETIAKARTEMRTHSEYAHFLIIRSQLMFDSRYGTDWREQGHATGRFSDGKPYGGYI
jgi:hypothetical protein